MDSSPPPRLAAALEGRYRIDRAIGQGGMATVFLAEDIRHDRRVALKVLRPDLAAVIGADRFLSEIKTTANLQHPHILPLHDSGEADGTVYYVMPFVEGESLRDRLRREQQLPVADAVRLAKEVASALDYAHRHGVVHRDIKPENILLHDGQALIADFGISLAVSRSEGGSRMTETGMSLGTPHYMAPEQAMGEREITARADIYALGCVLYEMLIGEPPFTGSTAQAVVARSLTESPRAIVTQRRTVPQHVEATALKALEKLPSDRFATAAEFAAALDDATLTRSLVSAPVGSAARRDWRVRLALPALAAVATAALAWSLRSPVPEPPLARYALAFPPTAAPLADRPLAIAPNGSAIAYVGLEEDGRTILFVKHRAQRDPVSVPGSSGANSFTFSPDGTWLAFITQGNVIRKWPLSGGAAVTVTDSVASLRGVAWLDDGTIVATTTELQSLFRVSAEGGERTIVWQATPDPVVTALHPTMLPGSKAILFVQCSGGNNCSQGSNLTALDLRSGRSVPIAGSVARGVYADGHIVYARTDGALLALPFDHRALSVRGSVVSVTDSIGIGATGFPTFDVSQSGTLLERSGSIVSSLTAYEFVWVDRRGGEQAVDSSLVFRPTVFGANVGWALSPDGRRIAFGQSNDAGDQIWVKELPDGPLSRVTFDSTPSFRPRWSPDGRVVRYLSRRTGNSQLFERRADGTGGERPVFALPTTPGIFEGAFAPDERTLVFRAGGLVFARGNRDIQVITLGRDSVPRPLVASPQFDESAIALSPDGRWLMYESDETGASEVYVRPFPDVESGRWQVSVGGGRSPLWNRTGREILYVNGRTVVAVPFTGGSSPSFGARTPLFTLRSEIYLASQENYTPFDISPDGSRFLMARRVNLAAERNSPLVVTDGWFRELRRLGAGR